MGEVPLDMAAVLRVITGCCLPPQSGNSNLDVLQTSVMKKAVPGLQRSLGIGLLYGPTGGGFL